MPPLLKCVINDTLQWVIPTSEGENIFQNSFHHDKEKLKNFHKCMQFLCMKAALWIKMKWLSFLNLLQTISSYSSDWAIFLNKKLCITCALIIWLMSSASSHFFSCSILFTKKIYKSNKFIALFNTLWQLISFV